MLDRLVPSLDAVQLVRLLLPLLMHLATVLAAVGEPLGPVPCLRGVLIAGTLALLVSPLLGEQSRALAGVLTPPLAQADVPSLMMWRPLLALLAFLSGYPRSRLREGVHHPAGGCLAR